MMKKYKFILILLLAMIPNLIYANAGTALMWVPIFQLIFGNILIGIIEGLAVAMIFKTKWIRSILIMIAGNYVSWLLGHGLILLIQEGLINAVFQLKGLFLAWIISLILLYFLTVFLELVFFNLTFEKEERSWKRSLKISFLLNIVTYVAMILIYLNVSEYSFFTDLKINQSLLNKEHAIDLFIKKGDKILTGNISSDKEFKPIFNVSDEYENLYLSVRESKTSKSIELLLVNYQSDTVIVDTAFTSIENISNYPKLFEKYSHLKFDYRDTIHRDWDIRAGGWAIDGLTIKNNDGVDDNFALEVPWMFWGIGDAAIISDTELICNFYGRLILMNRKTKEIAFITKAENYILRKRQ